VLATWRFDGSVDVVAKQQRKSSRKNLTLALMVMVIAAFVAHIFGHGNAAMGLNALCVIVGGMLYYRTSTEQQGPGGGVNQGGHLWSLKLTAVPVKISPHKRKLSLTASGGSAASEGKLGKAERESEARVETDITEVEGQHYFLCGSSYPFMTLEAAKTQEGQSKKNYW
jgi:hypothetical protein